MSTTPAADFCCRISVNYSTLSHESETCNRSPAISPTAFDTRPPDLPPAPLMDTDFAISCPLVRRRRPQIRFLSIGPYLCSTLPLDPTSRWCPCASLPFTSIRLGRDFHPLAAEHARRTTKRAADFSAARRHSQNYLFSLTRHDLPESARIYRDFSRSRRRVVRVTRSVRPRGS